MSTDTSSKPSFNSSNTLELIFLKDSISELSSFSFDNNNIASVLQAEKTEDNININILYSSSTANITTSLDADYTLGTLALNTNSVVNYTDGEFTIGTTKGSTSLLGTRTQAQILDFAGGTLTLGNSTYTPKSTGRAINQTGGTLNLNNITLTGFTTTENGGAIYKSAGTLTLTSCTLTNNTAASGPAVYNNSGTLNLNGGDISSNTATTTSGDVYLSSSAYITLNASLTKAVTVYKTGLTSYDDNTGNSSVIAYSTNATYLNSAKTYISVTNYQTYHQNSTSLKTNYLVCEYKSYTATFNGNGGSNGTSITKKYKAALGTLPTSSRTGYTFNGWYTAASGGTQISTTTTMPANNITYYAHWTANTITITLNNQSATSAGSTAVYYKYYTNKYYSNSGCTTQITSITCPTKTGYTFGGYYTATNGGGTQYITAAGAFTNNLYSAVSSNTTLYAKWTANTYTISYTLNGGTKGSSAPTSATYGTAFTVSNPTRTGYNFVGWNITGMDSCTHYVGTSSTTSTSTSASAVTGTYFNNLRSTNGTVIFEAQWEEPAGLFNSTTGALIYTWQQLIDNKYVTVSGTTITSSKTSLAGKLVISPSVTSIGDFAFEECYNLTSITIPDSVTSIGDSAFTWCDGLTSITIPNSVTSIGIYAFYHCSGLTSVTIGSGVKSIVDSPFVYCSGLTSLTVDSQNQQYHSSGNCIIETSTNTLIAGCKTSVIPNYVTSIGEYAFYYCDSLTSITIPDSVTSIGEGAFNSCSGLTSITIPNSVTSIGSSAFRYCSGVTSYDFTTHTTVPTLGSDVFNSINSECKIYVPANLYDQWIAATNWSSWKDYIVPIKVAGSYDANENLTYTWQELVDNGYVTLDGTTITSFNTSLAGKLVIPNSVTSIGDSAFEECRRLTSVTIGNSVTSIGDDAFFNCRGLTSVTIGDNVKSIGEYAFYDCTSLTSITIPNSVTSIGYGAFSSCSGLTSITIPNSVTSIGDFAFGDCSGLTSITVDSQNQQYHSSGNCIIETSTNTLIAGCKTSVIPNYVTSIGNSAFAYCTGLTSVTIPNSVTSIGDRAFRGCSKVTSITIPNSVTSIGEYAFYDCTSLTSITIPNSVTSIGDSAFKGCSGLTGTLTIPDSVTSIDDNAFSGCSKLTSVTIGNSVTSIGDYAFRDCTKLTSITIPNSVTSIGYDAFNSCSKVTSIFIPKSVTTITAGSSSSSPFYGCSSRLKIYCEASAKQSGWGTYWNYYDSSNTLTTYYSCTRDAAGNIYNSSGTKVVSATAGSLNLGGGVVYADAVLDNASSGGLTAANLKLGEQQVIAYVERKEDDDQKLDIILDKHDYDTDTPPTTNQTTSV